MGHICGLKRRNPASMRCCATSMSCSGVTYRGSQEDPSPGLDVQLTAGFSELASDNPLFPLRPTKGNLSKGVLTVQRIRCSKLPHHANVTPCFRALF